MKIDAPPNAHAVFAPEALMMIALDDVAEDRYGVLRLASPSGQARIKTSLATYGQLSPIVVQGGDGPPYQLLDGFKRTRAARELEALSHLSARRLAVGQTAAKAAVIQLNHASGSVSAVEEGLAIRSLVRDDGLSQLEVAALFGRHPSWVCRRLALVERLCDEALERVRVGLVSPAVSRELAKLPRGNQPMLLDCLDRHQLTWRESARLVAGLLSRPRDQWNGMLANPTWAVDATTLSAAKAGAGERPLDDALDRLSSVGLAVAKRLDTLALPQPIEIIDAGARTLVTCRRLGRALNRLVGEPSKREAEVTSD